MALYHHFHSVKSESLTMVNQITAPKDVHARIHGTQECVPLYGKKDFADVVKVTDPKIGRLFRWAQSKYPSKELSSGKGRKVEAEVEVREIRSVRTTRASISGIEEEGGHKPGNEGIF